MNHNSTKPTSAPSLVVMINSPEPTIDPTRIMPGPRCFNVPRKLVGGSLNESTDREYGFATSGSPKPPASVLSPG